MIKYKGYEIIAFYEVRKDGIVENHLMSLTDAKEYVNKQKELKE